jgi:hypothetical protein
MEYKPLDFSRFETRFLVLVDRPADTSQPLIFSLKSGSLSCPPKYRALSYCWGDVSHTSTIEIDGKPVQVSRNLVEALYNSDPDDDVMYLWADAICINQADLYEKMYQVKLMGQIYSKAEKVIVWLGTEAPYSSLASELLGQVQRNRELSHPGFTLHTGAASAEKRQMGRSELEGTSLRNFDPEFAKAIRWHDHPTRALQGLRELLERPYWERVWIIQEIAKAGEVKIYCGKLRLNLETMISAARSLKDLTGRSRTLLAAIDIFRAQEQHRIDGTHRMSLLQALVASRHSLATDQRDKVYAILGLTSDGVDLVPTPTYADSVKDIFQGLTTAIIASQRPGNILLLASRVPLRYRFPDANQCAVDWAELGHNLPPWLSSRAEILPISGRATKYSEPAILHTSGRFIGSITEGEDGLVVRPSITSISHRNANREADILASAGILSRLCSSLLEKLGANTAVAMEMDRKLLTRALSRMIRDAHKSTMGNQDLSQVHDTLQRLGSIVVDNEYIREWARFYNAFALRTETNEADSYSAKAAKRFWRRDTGARRSSSITLETFSPPQAIPLVAFRAWEDILAGLDISPEFGLSFATLDGGSLVLVCDQAHAGDHVYQIEHSHLPVVLREKWGDTFELVGEVCLGRLASGEWEAAINPTLLPAGQHREPTSTVKWVTIDLAAPRRIAR